MLAILLLLLLLLVAPAVRADMELDEDCLRRRLGADAILVQGRRFFAAARPDTAAGWPAEDCRAALGAAVDAAEALFDGFVARFDRAGAVRRRAERHGGPFALYLFATSEAMSTFLDATGEPLRNGEPIAAGYFLSIGRMVLVWDVQRGRDIALRTVRHEVAHLLWDILGGLDESGCGIGGAGYWVVEGLAVELSAGPEPEALELDHLRTVHQAAQRGDLPALDSLLKMDYAAFMAQHDERTNIHYAAAWALAHHLLVAAGPKTRDAFLDYVARLETIPPDERQAALLIRLNTTLVDLERDWHEHIAELAARHAEALKAGSDPCGPERTGRRRRAPWRRGGDEPRRYMGSLRAQGRCGGHSPPHRTRTSTTFETRPL